MDISYQYVLQCRSNTLNSITPGDVSKYNTEGYKSIIEIGKRYIREQGLEEFMGNFQGDQYFVELWTAHIVFDYGEANTEIKAKCVRIIKKYSNHPFDFKVSREE